MRRVELRALAFASVCLLSGCTAIPDGPGTMAGGRAVTTSEVGGYQNNIDLQGRLSVRYQRNGKEEGLHGNFEWHQRGQDIDLALRSPLGQTLAQIAVRNGHAQLSQSGQPIKTARDVDSLVTDTLGWPLPIAGLHQWLQGQGKRSDGSRFVASQQFDSVTTQDGWRLRYVSWHDDGKPKRIDLERNTVEAGEVGLKLVLDAQ